MTQTVEISAKNADHHFGYRPDIDGLRAIAVLAVVAFHLGFARLEGGFLGVDIFFVISGYLITSIITPKMMAGQFSFKEFYLKRIRRLIPPALVTVAFTFLASAFILDPSDLLAMAKSAIAAVFSVSNILFFTEAGYWDAQSELKPLLHTWSLGVEEQFYLFWPLLVFLLWKVLRKRHFAIAFAIITVTGIVVSEWMLRLNPSAAFYLLPARVFEFSIGACFAFIAKTEVWARLGTTLIRLILGWASLLLIAVTIFTYKGSTPFPGLNGVLPCLATAVLLLCGAGRSPLPLLGPLLSNGFMTWVGRISYSLYLVHWPVVALMRYKVGLELHLPHQIMAAIIMLILTLMLYYGVEQRISARAGQSKSNDSAKSKPPRNGRFAIGTGLTALSLSAVFAHAVVNSGWTWRFPDISFTPERILELKSGRYRLEDQICDFVEFPDGGNCKPSKPLKILVMGDSHEWDGINFLDGAITDTAKYEIIRFGQVSQCKKRRSNDGELLLNDPKCQQRVDKLLRDEIADQIDLVIYSAHKPYFPNETILLKLIAKLKSLNSDVKLVVIGSYIVTEKPCPQIVNETGNLSACVMAENAIRWPEMDREGVLYDRFMELADGVIDRGALLCDGEQPTTCEGATPKGELMMVDTNHLTFEFAQYSGQKFATQYSGYFDDILSNRVK